MYVKYIKGFYKSTIYFQHYQNIIYFLNFYESALIMDTKYTVNRAEKTNEKNGNKQNEQ